jgi:CRISPR/Cas system-associated exonuclease Cas4 (RecB family)
MVKHGGLTSSKASPFTEFHIERSFYQFLSCSLCLSVSLCDSSLKIKFYSITISKDQMTYFLEHIAESLYNEFGNTLNRHCLVFPNRRAGIYFMKYLAARIEKPVWAPSVLTINELFRSFSLLQIPGNEILLFELYKAYDKLKKPHESFDEFYYWGDMLLNDFDDVDKYLVNASVLFRNVLDLKNIDAQFGTLTYEQVEIIKRFWTNFNYDKPTNEKKGFISIWSILSDLYTGFRETLRQQNLAYEGMVFRDVTQCIEAQITFDERWDIAHFIGFNALNNCEKVLMKEFKKTGKARFYWDYDNSYIKESRLNSAGFFLRENIKMFGSDMPSGWSFDTMLTKRAPAVYRKVIDTSSDVAQVKLVSQLLEEIPDINESDAHHTAVVLSDENLLMPVLTSLPENMGDINITMGHPLKQTLVYTLIRHLMDLQTSAVLSDGVVHFASGNVISILKHPLLTSLLSESETELVRIIAKTNLYEVSSDYFSKSELLSFIFKRISTPAELSGYFKDVMSIVASDNERKNENDRNIHVQTSIRNEFIYRVVLSLNRLEAIVNTPSVPFTLDTYIKILDRLLRTQSVPFSGEPLSGIQIMGILETRALDFKNLIILSVNEGILPAISSGSSFIPFSLREAFGLPSLNHQESIFAYHFYRLLQRAENVTFIYNSNSEGLRSGEMSRFLIQMKYEEALKPVFFDYNFEIKTPVAPGERIERAEVHSEQLVSLFLDKSNERAISPSAINTWLNCRMKFYYRYVNRLKEPEIISSDIDPAMLGNILHGLMKNLYSTYVGKELTGEIISGIISNRNLLARIINNELSNAYKSGRNGSVSGNELIVRDVLMAYLNRILHTDRSRAPFTILNLEDTFKFLLPFVSNGSELNVLIGGNIDRVDTGNRVTRIVDYKTGTVSESIKEINDLFTDDRKKDPDGWLQTLLYCEAYLASNPGIIVRPSIYKIKKMNSASTEDRLKISSGNRKDSPIDNYLEIREEFISCLKNSISVIFSQNEPFIKTKDRRSKCLYCSYRTLCMR